MIKQRPNIYPRTVENIKAVLLYHFPEEKHSLIDDYAEQLYDERKLELNEIEFIAEIIASNNDLFESLFKTNYINNVMATFFGTTYTALFIPESKWSGSANRINILKTVKNQLS